MSPYRKLKLWQHLEGTNTVPGTNLAGKLLRSALGVQLLMLVCRCAAGERHGDEPALPPTLSLGRLTS